MANSQFTPRQVLEAGRRAEEDGKRDHAIQFYQHVLAHHAATVEGQEAADALRRLEGGDGTAGRDPRAQPYAGPVPSTQQQIPARPPHHAQGYPQQTDKNPPLRQSPSPLPPHYTARPAFEVDPVPPTQPPKQKLLRNGHDPVSHRQPARKPKEAGSGSSAELSNDERPHAGSRRRKTYRFGRFVASMLGMLGFIGAIAGMVSLGANLVLWSTRMQNSLLSMLASGPLVSAVLVAGALVLILLSQMAKATFDAAGDRSRSSE